MSQLKSCLYDCQISHQRYTENQRFFRYKISMFCLDLEELEQGKCTSLFFRQGRFGFFSISPQDHLRYSNSKPGQSLREGVLAFLQTQGISQPIGKILLLGGMRVLGYGFNPVCFYYIYNVSGRLSYILSEVTNTFHDQKPYLLNVSDHGLRGQAPKNFYVSPFLKHERSFQFQFKNLAEELQIIIDTIHFDEVDKVNANLELRAVLKGKRKQLNKRNLILNFLRYPLLPVKIVAAIHWQALKLFLKRVPFFKKDAVDREIMQATEKDIQALEWVHGPDKRNAA